MYRDLTARKSSVLAGSGLAQLGLIVLIMISLTGHLTASFHVGPVNGVVDPTALAFCVSQPQVEDLTIAYPDSNLPKEICPFHWLGGLPIAPSQSSSSSSTSASASSSCQVGSLVKFELDDDLLVRWLSEEGSWDLPSPNPTELLRPPNVDCETRIFS